VLNNLKKKDFPNWKNRKMNHAIYMLQTREFVNNNQSIYKIGRTQQPLLTRFNQYSKGSLLIIHINVKDSIISEKEIISVFTKQFTCKKDVGREYFEGDISKMKKVLFEICCREDETPEENVQGVPACAEPKKLRDFFYYDNKKAEINKNRGLQRAKLELDNRLKNQTVEPVV
jgi:hypothetical protein